jgi:hypothetical protein
VSAAKLPTKSYSKRPVQGTILRQRLDRAYDIQYDDGKVECAVNKSRIQFIKGKGSRCQVTAFDMKPTKTSREACSFLKQIDLAIKSSDGVAQIDSVKESLKRYQSSIPTHEDSQGYDQLPVSPRHGWAPITQKFLG